MPSHFYWITRSRDEKPHSKKILGKTRVQKIERACCSKLRLKDWYKGSLNFVKSSLSTCFAKILLWRYLKISYFFSSETITFIIFIRNRGVYYSQMALKITWELEAINDKTFNILWLISTLILNGTHQFFITGTDITDLGIHFFSIYMPRKIIWLKSDWPITLSIFFLPRVYKILYFRAKLVPSFSFFDSPVCAFNYSSLTCCLL
jgi:hypothetical protein